jgi:hypothetical protein
MNVGQQRGGPWGRADASGRLVPNGGLRLRGRVRGRRTGLHPRARSHRWRRRPWSCHPSLRGAPAWDAGRRARAARGACARPVSPSFSEGVSTNPRHLGAWGAGGAHPSSCAHRSLRAVRALPVQSPRECEVTSATRLTCVASVRRRHAGVRRRAPLTPAHSLPPRVVASCRSAGAALRRAALTHDERSARGRGGRRCCRLCCCCWRAARAPRRRRPP